MKENCRFSSGKWRSNGGKTMNSKICEILNIRYPIMQGAFQWLAAPGTMM